VYDEGCGPANFMRRIALLFGCGIFVGTLLAQSTPNIPSDPGMYVVTARGAIKIVGQIVTFRRTGSLFVSGVTGGIKTRKQNVQLLGQHAQTVTDAAPVFYFIPAKQEAESGVNAGDLVLVHLEEKSKRRQFEIGAQGLWRASSGITLTHQVQLFRTEENAGVYKVLPANPLQKGEYALYVARGNGLAAYVYDFSVEREYTGSMSAFQPKITPRGESPESASAQPTLPQPMPVHSDQSAATGKSESPSVKSNASPVSSDTASVSPPVNNSASGVPVSDVDEESSIGAGFRGRPTERHDGVEVSEVQRGGAVEEIGVKAGDFILAIDDHYVFTIQELHDQLVFRPGGSRAAIRYRRHSLIYDTFITIDPHRP
jgi:hypothetical protein